MKLLITSKGSNFLDPFDIIFGRCEYFILYNSELNTFKAIKNDAKNLEEGAGIDAAQVVMDLNVDVLLTGRLGPKARRKIEDSDIKVHFVEGETVADVVEEYKKSIQLSSWRSK